MRVTWVWMTAALLAAGAAGCRKDQQAEADRHGMANEAMIRLIFQQSAQNALVTEHALYPHHFVPNHPELNDLGYRHLDLIASAYRTAPGPLNVARGGVPDALYEARVQTVVRHLNRAGVDTGRVRISDDLPGGETAVTTLRTGPQLEPQTPAGRDQR